MKPYRTIFEKKILQESISFLDLYKTADQDIMAMVENFIKQFNAPRTEIYKALSSLFTVMANEAEQQVKEKAKKKRR